MLCTLLLLPDANYFHRGVVTGNAADCSTSFRSGAAKENIRMPGFNSPLTSFFCCFYEGPSEITVEDITFGKMDFGFQVDCAHRLDAGISVRIFCQATFDGFLQKLIDGVQVFFNHFVSDAIVVFFKKAIRQIETEEGDGLKTTPVQVL